MAACASGLGSLNTQFLSITFPKKEFISNREILAHRGVKRQRATGWQTGSGGREEQVDKNAQTCYTMKKVLRVFQLRNDNHPNHLQINRRDHHRWLQPTWTLTINLSDQWKIVWRTENPAMNCLMEYTSPVHLVNLPWFWDSNGIS